MRTSSSIACLVALLAGAITIAAQPPSSPRQAPSPAPPPAAAAAAPRFVPTGTIKELMHGVIDPAADGLWDSVSFDITAAGVVETLPRTAEEWYAVRRHALILAEAANLLRVPGRRVAPAAPIPGLEDEPPYPGDLPMEEIQKLLDADPARFGELSQGLVDAAVLAIGAVDARSVDRLSAAGDQLDRACEACHLEYWYPKGKAQATPTSVRKKP